MNDIGYEALMFRGRAMVVVKPIDDTDFDNLEELRQAVEKQGFPYIIATEKAWTKYESLLFREWLKEENQS